MGALDAFLTWRGDARAQARLAVEAAPGEAMAHVQEAQMHLCSRDPGGVPSARAAYARARALPQDARSRMHVAALGTALSGDFDRARGFYDCILAHHPRDLLALAVAHTIDHLVGDARALKTRVEAVLPAWSRSEPGYHGVLAMHAFGLAECGEYTRAEDAALAALELEPGDIRAHHARCHVLEMQGRAAQGLRWMGERSAYWTGAGAASAHIWWHLALYQLELGQVRLALELYDRRIRGESVNELIDAAALLWRLELRGAETGERWTALAESWAKHAQDAYCAFNDVHAMAAFVGAGRHDLQKRLLRAQRQRLARGGTNHGMIRDVGLPACEAFVAFGERRYSRAAELLAALPTVSHRLGGSHAQRGLLGLTLRAATNRDSPHLTLAPLGQMGTVPG
jgi:tetratricopeptide (TPR) repeat protein